ncbi:DNA cytosine methyltransferase [Mycoplasmopsis agassizii]|uniref:Cytosine-specific methyltransferase n=1 Tax=Mycoplasmopsis agassizii TaxID=33922 RepID=A0ABX4H5B6_9BACT|nr:DNA cytosine methyltransferase [Mycoplasmopsis agassizii]PAF55084.1 DNA cytosine methyltransferase [Mycoplasmopsis agassizii]SMC19150.1 DNA (cytosine-5)-methyltransferase 1 [Mycoplasmopsis agassizii]
MIIERFNYEKEKLSVLDLFCGAGGLSYGFHLANFKIFGGIDINNDSLLTHKHNFPESEFHYCGDISKINDSKIDEIKNKVDVIIGGPPCQGFSSANRYGHLKDDPRNKLFFEYLRFVKIIQPKAFVIENVAGILTKDNGFAKNRILEITEELGYRVTYNVLNASDFGVPQVRRRAVFVAIRNDLDFDFDITSLKPYKTKFTVFDAIGDLFDSNLEMENEFLNYVRDLDDYKQIKNHEESKHSKAVVERIKHVPQGGNWRDVPVNLWETQRDNRHSSAYKRLNFKEASITIDTGHMNYFHPVKDRVPTVRESARLQSFPDSFEFLGSKVSQYKQVGNAVPPLLSYAIANQLRKLLMEKICRITK